MGGDAGYAEFLEAVTNPAHKKHSQLRQWGGDLDAERFGFKGVKTALWSRADARGRHRKLRPNLDEQRIQALRSSRFPRPLAWAVAF